MEEKEIPKWKRFERLIHQIHEQYGISGAQIKLDDRVEGQDSKTLRQIDISIRTQIGPYKIFIAVECKDHATPLDVGDVGAFAALKGDVRASKGVMVATGGFTTAAVELARTYGIDTRTYIDTVSDDWGTDVSVPILLKSTKIIQRSFTFSTVRTNPFLPFAMRTDIPAELVELRTPEGEEIGPLILLLGRRWNQDESLHVPGEHTFTLIEHAQVDAHDHFGHARIEAHIKVEWRLYSGPLGVHLSGFRDEQSDSIQTRRMITEAVEPRLMELGLVQGWRELEEYRNYDASMSQEPGTEMLMVDGVPLKAMMTFAYRDAFPQTREELAEELQAVAEWQEGKVEYARLDRDIVRKQLQSED
jgi:Restriction endonuclease